jgi:hypothetical protein
MSIFSPAFILLVILLGVICLIGNPKVKAVKQAERELSADELKIFRENYSRKARRGDMPSRFEEIARASDAVTRLWLISVVLLLAALTWIILAGHGLGLVPKSE